MNKEFVQKGILLPVITAAVLSAAFTAAMLSKAPEMIPFSNGATLAYHDNAGDESCIIGSFKGNTEIPLASYADYTQSASVAQIMEQGNLPSENGCAYIRLTFNNALAAGNDLLLTWKDGEAEYSLETEMKMTDENEILSLAPKGEKSLVVYYRNSNAVGIAPDYTVLIYKEAK